RVATHARSPRRARPSRARLPAAPWPPTPPATRGGSRTRAPAPARRGRPPPAPGPPAPSHASPDLRGGHRAAPTALPGGAAPAGARARTRAPAHVTASGSSHRGSSCQQGGAAGAPLERGDEVRKRLRQKVLARDPGRRDRPLDTGRLALHLEEDVHVGIPLEPQHRVPQPVDLDAPIDAQRLGEAEPLEDGHHTIRISHAGLGLGAAPISPLFGVRALPAEHTVRRSAVGRLEHPQPQYLVPVGQPVAAVEAPVEHVAPELEDRAGTHERGAQRVGILDPRLDLELVDGYGRGPAHAKMASSTAAVSASVANTYAAPAARRAATS